MGNDELKEELSALRKRLPPAPDGFVTFDQLGDQLGMLNAEVKKMFGFAAERNQPDRHGRPVVAVEDARAILLALADGKDAQSALGFVGD